MSWRHTPKLASWGRSLRPERNCTEHSDPDTLLSVTEICIYIYIYIWLSVVFTYLYQSHIHYIIIILDTSHAYPLLGYVFWIASIKLLIIPNLALSFQAYCEYGKLCRVNGLLKRQGYNIQKKSIKPPLPLLLSTQLKKTFSILPSAISYPCMHEYYIFNIVNLRLPRYRQCPPSTGHWALFYADLSEFEIVGSAVGVANYSLCI